jgi:hypothetical protein
MRENVLAGVMEVAVSLKREYEGKLRIPPS